MVLECTSVLLLLITLSGANIAASNSQCEEEPPVQQRGLSHIQVVIPKNGSEKQSTSVLEFTATPVLRVAMVCPMDEKRFAKNAADAAKGWDLWMQAARSSVQLSGGELLKVESTPISFNESTRADAMSKVRAGNFHMVIGCSTHYFKEVLSDMQASEVPNLQCNAGNPFVWDEISLKAKQDGKPLYGFGIHAPFTAYPLRYLTLAKAAFEDRKVRPRVGLVLGQDNQFTRGLCDAAVAAAAELKLSVVGGGKRDFHFVENATELAPQVDILYGCTLLDDGLQLMQKLAVADRRPGAVSITVAASKPEFAEMFGMKAAYIAFPGQWHHEVQSECGKNDYCPKDLASAAEYKRINNATPSYDRASCTAAGIALGAAASTLPSNFLTSSLADQRQLLLGALAAVDTNSFFGKIRFDASSHMNVGHKVVITQYQPAGEGIQQKVVGKDTFKINPNSAVAEGFSPEAENNSKSGAASLRSRLAVVCIFGAAVSAVAR